MKRFYFSFSPLNCCEESVDIINDTFCRLYAADCCPPSFTPHSTVLDEELVSEELVKLIPKISVFKATSFFVSVGKRIMFKLLMELVFVED